MPSGGARARSGPPPDPNALRRDRDSKDWLTLPPEGRIEPAPAFPLSRATKREKTVWERMWRKPQALEWERLGLEDEVAMHVRTLVAAEKLDAKPNVRTLVRQQQTELGLNLSGMRMNRWKIGEPQGSTVAKPGPARTSAKDRFKVVPGGVAST